jgi:adenosine deaminase
LDGRSDRRDLRLLPKAHLHLHFTGSLDQPTLAVLAAEAGERLTEELLDPAALAVPATVRGWFRFQRLYDLARRTVHSEQAMRRVVRQAAINDAAEGSVRLEIQIDPTSYAPYVGGIIEALEIVLDEARASAIATGVSIGVIVAASRIRHPMEARSLARLAAKHMDDGVVGFGLSNDEWSGSTPEWEGAFRIAHNAGLPGVPHGGELRGADHVRQVVAALHPARLGHGVRTTEDPQLLEELVNAGTAFEVCPSSNVQLGVFASLDEVPLPQLIAAGATVALGADDPLLFHTRMLAQYELAREVFGLTDAQLADLARSSIRASFASDSDKADWLAGVDAWLHGSGATAA